MLLHKLIKNTEINQNHTKSKDLMQIEVKVKRVFVHFVVVYFSTLEKVRNISLKVELLKTLEKCKKNCDNIIGL